MSVYEYCMNEAELNRTNAQRAATKSLFNSFLGDAAIWESRALHLSVEDASKDVDEVLLWRIFEKRKGTA